MHGWIFGSKTSGSSTNSYIFRATDGGETWVSYDVNSDVGSDSYYDGIYCNLCFTSAEVVAFALRHSQAGNCRSRCYGAYALGSNNVGNVTGVYVGAGMLSPLEAALIGSISISLGVFTYSKHMMYVIGKRIYPLLDFSALVVVIAEATTLYFFTQFRIPVSASLAVIGTVLGIGILNDMRPVRSHRLAAIFAGWLITPLMTMLLTIFFLSIFLSR